MKAAQRIPVEPFPGAPVVVQTQGEQRQHRTIDLLRVEIHAHLAV
jgi:hypothetical protein